jgi:uncharacterized protein (TIGR04222 family)
MNFVTDNPLVNLHGPAFLGVFAVICVVAIVWTRARVHRLDTTDQLPVPELPAEIDPFEVAYLRGGHTELVRLIILDLIARGYLQHVEEKARLSKRSKIGPVPSGPELNYLDAAERFVFSWIGSGKSASEIMPRLPAAFERQGVADELHREMLAQQFLTTHEQKMAALNAMLLPAVIIVVLATYKILIALSRGHTNIGFLIALGFLTLIAIGLAGSPSRFTKRGRAYLQRMRDALGQLRDRAHMLVTGGHSDHLILTVAAFGVGVLQGTSYAYFPSMFEQAAMASGGYGDAGGGSGCGSSCGSSCGGGCGGGCGGCGS